jgi:hypothetical protein
MLFDGKHFEISTRNILEFYKKQLKFLKLVNGKCYSIYKAKSRPYLFFQITRDLLQMVLEDLYKGDIFHLPTKSKAYLYIANDVSQLHNGQIKKIDIFKTNFKVFNVKLIFLRGIYGTKMVERTVHTSGEYFQRINDGKYNYVTDLREVLTTKVTTFRSLKQRIEDKKKKKLYK